MALVTVVRRVQFLAQELPHAAGESRKKEERKEKKTKGKKRKEGRKEEGGKEGRKEKDRHGERQKALKTKTTKKSELLFGKITPIAEEIV